MEFSAYPAFGYVLVRCKINAGEIIQDISVGANNVMNVSAVSANGVATVNGSEYVWLHISGQQTYTEQATGEKTIRVPGWCNLVENIAVGLHDIHVDVSSEHICFSTHLNETRNPQLPPISLFKIFAGGSMVVEQKTKLYLAEGVLDVSGAKIQKMRQVYFKSGAKIVVADTDCLGFIFHN